MTFSTRVSKFGKGQNISAIMNSKSQISIYYYLKGIMKKEVSISGDSLSLKTSDKTFAYRQVVPIKEGLLATRIEKSIGVINE